MMKKITALLLAMVMVFALCACGNNSDDKKTDDNADASKIKVGFIFLHDENSTYDLNFMNAAELYRDVALHKLGRNTALLLTRYETVNDYGDVPGRIDFSVAHIHDCP